MGCYNGLQAWFFRNHLLYIGVDLATDEIERLELKNTEYFTMSISDFIKERVILYPHFAICNYVPPWHDDNQKLVRENFKHCFVYYPETAKLDKPSFAKVE